MANILDLKIFEGIEKEQVKEILDGCKTRNYSKGEIIVLEGTQSNGEGYIIMEGEVVVTLKGEIIAELKSGDIFGEIALLNEEDRVASVEAKTDLKVIILTMDNLLDLINNDSNRINKEIMKRITQNLEK